VEACLAFARDYHLLVGGSTGAVLTAVQQMSPEFAPGETVVAISPDLGEKYLDTIYDKDWVENVIGLKPKAAHKENKSWQPHRDSTSFPARPFGV
jgi:cysteine synthase A